MGGMKDQLGDRPYPYAPGFKEQGSTSEEAAHSMTGRAKTLRDHVYALLKARPRTADEIAGALSESVLSVRPRLSELRARGQIMATAERRPNKSGKMATVWAVLPR